MVSGKKPLVAVVMGSDSDLGVMESCVEQLRQFGIEPSVRVLSAHRTPQDACAFAEGAEAAGIKVIVAAAGMAAHLAGALASRTTLPVIGVPLVAAPGLGGRAARRSPLQMPPGGPRAPGARGKPPKTPPFSPCSSSPSTTTNCDRNSPTSDANRNRPSVRRTRHCHADAAASADRRRAAAAAPPTVPAR